MKTNALLAKTHPAEYLIHKYWARKPHNILEYYIRTFFKKNDLLVDPFCGSGVFLAEAKKQNIDSIGFDINPIASLLSSVTANPADIAVFQKEAEKLIIYAKNKYQDYYTVNGNPIRYTVHEVQSKCNRCSEIGSVSLSNKVGRKYTCHKCGNKLSFNFENLCGTRIVKIYDKNNTAYTDEKVLLKQQQTSMVFKPTGKFDSNLLINRRILAFPGMKVSDLFTGRSYTLLSDLFTKAHEIKNRQARESILLFLTSAVAQCSRLIPYRNNLSTGGPAWTVPGFWIAPLHLETNPLIHLEARYKKFSKGLEALKHAYKDSKTSVKINNVSAQDGLETLPDNSIDGIFFDPPYGDNVPYVEFSDIWNSFLKHKRDYEKEIIVSDRKEFISSWEKYEKEITDVILLFHKKVKRKGKVIMTFNNLDPRAWKIVLNAFKKATFICVEAKYQIPAVISSKAQMSANTSYVGDYYCVFEKGTKNVHANTNLYLLSKKMKDVLLSREGKAPVNLLNRIAVLTILNNNYDLSFIDKIDEAIVPIAERNGDYYLLRSELRDSRLFAKFDIKKKILQIAVSELKTGKKNITELYEKILESTDGIGSLPLSDIKDILKNNVFFEKEHCYLQDYKQLPLF